MTDRRTFLLCLATALFGGAGGVRSALAGKGGGSGGNSGSGGDHGGDDHGGDDGGGEEGGEDHDRARAAVVRGKAIPLEDILKLVRADYGGEVIDVRTRQSNGVLYYDLKCIDRQGRLLEVRVNAMTRQIRKLRGF